MSSTRHMILGAFLAATMLILGYYTLFLTEFDFLGESHEVTIHFPDAHGLRDGDAVLVAGVRWGKVKGIEYMPEGDADHRIQVSVTLQRPLDLREGHSFVIKDATMLGGRILIVDPGPYDSPSIGRDVEYMGSVAPNALDAIGELVNENAESLTATLDNLEAFSSDLRSSEGLLGKIVSDKKLASDVTSMVANLESVSSGLAAGTGTIGRLLSDDAIYEKLVAIGDDLSVVLTDARGMVGDARGMFSDIRSGDGLVASLINDSALKDDVATAVADLRAVIAGARAGEGTLGQLITNSQLYDDFATIGGRLANGEGTIGKLLTEDEVYADLRKISDDIATITDSLRNGDGTIAKLINDGGLYDDLRKVVGVALRSLEEYREAAPITTFTSVLFGAF